MQTGGRSYIRGLMRDADKVRLAVPAIEPYTTEQCLQTARLRAIHTCLDFQSSMLQFLSFYKLGRAFCWYEVSKSAVYEN